MVSTVMNTSVSKAKSNLPTVTPEVLAMAKEAKAANNARRRSSTLRSDFADADYWLDLANARGVRLPPWGDAPTPSRMRSFLNRVKLTNTGYLKLSGERDMEQFGRANPDWPSRAWAGCVLEMLTATAT